jgi:hypothetical protein
LSFRIDPPIKHAAVVVTSKAPLLIDVVGPKPLYLVNSRYGKAVTKLEVTVPDNSRQASIIFHPILTGPTLPTAGQTLPVRLVSPDKRFKLLPNFYQLNTSQPVTIDLANADPRSFFRDKVQTVEIHLIPVQPTPSVHGTKMYVHVTSRAPFMRLLMYLSVSLCSLGAVAVVFWTFGKLRKTD